MMILKRKEVIAASLVVLIGLAGYLNWSYQDTVQVRDNDSYVQTGKMLGEAEMVSSNNETSEDTAQTSSVENTAYFEDAKANRESARSSAMEILKQTSENGEADETTRTQAGEKLIQCAENIEAENTIESVAAAKGFNEVCAYINEGSAIVTVRQKGLDETQTSILCEIVKDATGIGMDKIKIVEVK